MSTNVSSIKSVNGGFQVTDASGKTSNVDLATLMMLLNIQLTETYDQQIASRMADMQARSNNMKSMTEALNILRNSKSVAATKAAGTKYDAREINRAETILANAGMKISKPIAENKNRWADTERNENGRASEAKVENALDTLIENVKSSLEAMGNDSQLENIKLQNLMQKRGNSFEMTTKVMDTDKQSVQSIIRNL